MFTNLLYPNFDGRSDVVSTRSSGAEGAWRTTVTGSEGGFVCP